MVRRSGGSSLVLVSLALALTPQAWAQTPPASAQPPVSAQDRATARLLAEEADKKLEAGDAKAALDLFLRADAIFPAPTLKLAAARAHLKLNQFVEAHEMMLDIARGAPQPGEPAPWAAAREAAQQEAKDLSARIPRIEIFIEGIPKNRAVFVSIDGRKIPKESLSVLRPINPGRHLVRAEAPGYLTSEQNIQMGEGEQYKLTLKLYPETPEPDTTTSAPPPPSASHPPPGTSNKPLMYVGFISGGVLAATGAVFGWLASSRVSEIKKDCTLPGGVCPLSRRPDADRAGVYATTSTITFALSAVGLGLGVYGLLVPAAPAAQAGASRLRVGVGPGSLLLDGRFLARRRAEPGFRAGVDADGAAQRQEGQSPGRRPNRPWASLLASVRGLRSPPLRSCRSASLRPSSASASADRRLSRTQRRRRRRRRRRSSFVSVSVSVLASWGVLASFVSVSVCVCVGAKRRLKAGEGGPLSLAVLTGGLRRHKQNPHSSSGQHRRGAEREPMTTTVEATNTAPRPAVRPDLPRANRAIVIPDFRLEERLTPEHLDFFETYGFIRFKRFLPRSRAEALYQALNEITADLVKRGVKEFNGVPLIGGKRDDGTPYFGRIPFASLHHAEFKRYLQEPRLQEIIRVMAPGFRIGEEERDGLVVNRFRNEPGAKYKNLGWHTDSLRDLAYFERPRRYLNVGFSITDSLASVGGLRLLPCTHNQPISSMLFHKVHFLDMDPDENELAIETEAGDLTIHDGRLWHRTALATCYGDASERCVMYLPLMNGPVVKKHAGSKTPFYFHLKKLVGY